MALDLEKMDIRKFLDTPEGQDSVNKFFAEQEAKEKLYSSQVDRFYNRIKGNITEVIDKIIAKYDSDEYVRKEYKLGYEPREDLFWVIKSIAKKYGTEVTKKNAKKYKKYINTFTGEAYVYEGYFIQVMHGQGSVVRIDKIK